MTTWPNKAEGRRQKAEVRAEVILVHRHFCLPPSAFILSRYPS
jgi:hypothetical protein